MLNTRTMIDLSHDVGSAYNLLQTVVPASNKMDYPAFGCFFCMLLEEWCLCHHADVTDVIQEISSLIHSVNSEMGAYLDSPFRESEVILTSKIIQIHQYLEDRRNHKVSGNQPKTGFIRDVVRLIKEAIALSLEESDEYDDLYDE